MGPAFSHILPSLLISFGDNPPDPLSEEQDTGGCDTDATSKHSISPKMEESGKSGHGSRQVRVQVLLPQTSRHLLSFSLATIFAAHCAGRGTMGGCDTNAASEKSTRPELRRTLGNRPGSREGRAWVLLPLTSRQLLPFSLATIFVAHCSKRRAKWAASTGAQRSKEIDSSITE